MKLAIVGSRDWTDRQPIFNQLTALRPTLVISGGATGADKLGANCARQMGIPVIEYLPQWDRFGRSAGAKRNRIIVDECDKLIAFWDGESKGTKISIDMARKVGKLLEIVFPLEGL